jgi:ATP-dependent Clp protease ATP-binding subunit ClpA
MAAGRVNVQNGGGSRVEADSMFERFTDRARRVVVLAQEEARGLNHDYIGTEHILLGLIHEGQSIATRALESLGIGLEPARRQVEEIVGRGKKAPSGHIPFTPRAKKGLELALREALQFSHSYIGPEHILLGLLREGDGVAAQVLVAMGADLNRVRRQVAKLIVGEIQESGAQQGGAEEAGPAVRSSGQRRVAFAMASDPAEGTAGQGTRLPGTSTAARDVWQIEVLHRLSTIMDRLSAIERHLGMKGGPAVTGGAEAGQPGSGQPGEPGGTGGGE